MAERIQAATSTGSNGMRDEYGFHCAQEALDQAEPLEKERVFIGMTG